MQSYFVRIFLCHYMSTIVCHCMFLFANHNRAYLIPILPAVKLSFSFCITVLIQRKLLHYSFNTEETAVFEEYEADIQHYL